MKIAGKVVHPDKIELFWGRVKQGKKNECWPWQGGLNSKKKGYDYGCFYLHGRSRLAHQLALSFYLIKDVTNNEIMHTCDVPRCCNPCHLRVGTHALNMQDMIQKGRRNEEKGEDRYNSKLTDDKVRKIRKLARLHQKYKGMNNAAIGKLFDVSGAVISKIVRRTAWKHVED